LHLYSQIYLTQHVSEISGLQRLGLGVRLTFIMTRFGHHWQAPTRMRLVGFMILSGNHCGVTEGWKHTKPAKPDDLWQLAGLVLNHPLGSWTPERACPPFSRPVESRPNALTVKCSGGRGHQGLACKLCCTSPRNYWCSRGGGHTRSHGLTLKHHRGD